MLFKNLIPAIAIVLVLVIASYFIGLTMGGQSANPKMQNLQKIDSLLASKAIQGSFYTQGIIKEIAGRDLVITAFTETGKEAASLTVPIKPDAQIVSAYVLPEGAPESEIKGKIKTADGKEYNTGEKQISFEELKAGDNVFIRLQLKPDYDVEGAFVQVRPADITPGKPAAPQPPALD
jgi:hypothetical protein